MFPSQSCPASADQDHCALAYPGDCFFPLTALVVGVVAKVIIFLAKFWYVTVPVVETLSAVPLAGVINRRQIIDN
jgi:hypothetical protein